MAPDRCIQRPDQRESRDRETDLRKKQLAADIDAVMKTGPGRRLLWHVLDKLGYGKTITDVNARVYGLVANQAIAIDLTREIKGVCRELYYLMETENEK